MKSSKQSFRKGLWAEKAREAYITAKRGGDVGFAGFDDWDDDDVIDIVGLSQPIDFSDYAPIPSPTGWAGLGE